MLYEKGEKSPGATTSLLCEAYATVESQPFANAALIEGTLQKTFDVSQTARLTCELDPFTHAAVPVLAKNAAKVPVSPGASDRKALSNWYVESNPAAASAGPPVRPATNPSASANAATKVDIRLITRSP